MSIEITLFAYRVLGAREWWVHRGRLKEARALSVVVRTGRVEWGVTVVVGDYR